MLFDSKKNCQFDRREVEFCTPQISGGTMSLVGVYKHPSPTHISLHENAVKLMEMDN